MTRAAAFFPTKLDAVRTAMEVLEKLSVSNFVETKAMTQDTCDIYGVLIDGQGWFLKLCIDETVPEVVIVSLHPLERRIVTNSGIVEP